MCPKFFGEEQGKQGMGGDSQRCEVAGGGRGRPRRDLPLVSSKTSVCVGGDKQPRAAAAAAVAVPAEKVGQAALQSPVRRQRPQTTTRFPPAPPGRFAGSLPPQPPAKPLTLASGCVWPREGCPRDGGPASQGTIFCLGREVWGGGKNRLKAECSA